MLNVERAYEFRKVGERRIVKAMPILRRLVCALSVVSFIDTGKVGAYEGQID